MTWPPPMTPAGPTASTEAGVRIDHWDTDLDDYEFALLGGSSCTPPGIDAVRRRPLPAARPVMDWPPTRIDWPPDAPTLARRCATALAAHAACELETFMYAPTAESLNAAREAIITDLGLDPSELLLILADHWDQLAGLGDAPEGGCSLLAFARHVLLEPVVGACALIWSALDSRSSGPDAPYVRLGRVVPGGTRRLERGRSGTHRLGRPAPRIPVDGDEANVLLASARAATLQAGGEVAQLAASIVRTSGWPGDTDLVLPLAARAIELARQHIEDIDPETDNDEIVDEIQSILLPPAHAGRMDARPFVWNNHRLHWLLTHRRRDARPSRRLADLDPRTRRDGSLPRDVPVVPSRDVMGLRATNEVAPERRAWWTLDRSCRRF